MRFTVPLGYNFWVAAIALSCALLDVRLEKWDCLLVDGRGVGAWAWPIAAYVILHLRLNPHFDEDGNVLVSSM